jgi:hypothetical protein
MLGAAHCESRDSWHARICNFLFFLVWKSIFLCQSARGGGGDSKGGWWRRCARNAGGFDGAADSLRLDGGRARGAGVAYAHVCSRMLTYAHVCPRVPTYADELEEQRAFEGGGVHGMKPGMPAPAPKPKLQWVKCRFEENSMDYLPQVFLDTSSSSSSAEGARGAGGAAAGGGGGGVVTGPGSASVVPPGYVGISLLGLRASCLLDMWAFLSCVAMILMWQDRCPQACI